MHQNSPSPERPSRSVLGGRGRRRVPASMCVCMCTCMTRTHTHTKTYQNKPYISIKHKSTLHVNRCSGKGLRLPPNPPLSAPEPQSVPSVEWRGFATTRPDPPTPDRIRDVYKPLNSHVVFIFWGSSFKACIIQCMYCYFQVQYMYTREHRSINHVSWAILNPYRGVCTIAA